MQQLTLLPQFNQFKCTGIHNAVNTQTTCKKKVLLKELYPFSLQVPVPHYGPAGWNAAHCGAALWVGAFCIQILHSPHLFICSQYFNNSHLQGHQMLTKTNYFLFAAKIYLSFLCYIQNHNYMRSFVLFEPMLLCILVRPK